MSEGHQQTRSWNHGGAWRESEAGKEQQPEASVLLVHTQAGASSWSWNLLETKQLILEPLVLVSTGAKVLPNPPWAGGADELPGIRLTRTIFRGRDSAEMRRELPARRPLQAAL